jgi:hypothetical protein
MYGMIQGHLWWLPGMMKKERIEDGAEKVQDLFGHRPIMTTT